MIDIKMTIGMRPTQSAPVESYAMMAGVAIAAFSAWVALRTYRRGKAAAREAQINQMFREMLAMEFQLYCTSFQPPRAMEAAMERFDRYKMWLLEELWLWVEERKKRLPFPPGERAHAKRENNDWAEVLRVHLERCGAAVRARDWGNERGYHASFQQLVKDVFAETPSVPEVPSFFRRVQREIMSFLRYIVG